MDWAEALAGFSDAESEALGELIWIGDKPSTAIVGSSSETLEIESGGYLRNESLTATIKSLRGLGVPKPRVNDLVELRAKVWRVHGVEAHERDTSLELTLEFLPDVKHKHPASVPVNPDILGAKVRISIQASKPSNVTAVISSSSPSKVTAESSPANPSELVGGTLANAPSDIEVEKLTPANASEVLSISSPLAPSEVAHNTAPASPSSPDAELPQIDIYLVAGQSNAHGHSSTSDLTNAQQDDIDDFYFYTSWHDSNTSDATDPQVYGVVTSSMVAGKTRGQGSSSTLSDSGQFGIEWGFAKKAKDIGLSSGNIGIIKYAVGASTIEQSSFSDWDINNTGEAWDGFKNAIADGIEKYNLAGFNVNIRGLVWYQGESNGGNSADTYLGYFEPFIQALETELGITNLPAVFCAPADQYGLDMPVDEAFNELARQYDYYDFIKISEYHDGTYNNVHLNGSNMYDAGEAVAPAMALAIAGNAPTSSEFTPSDITTRLWLDMDDRATHNITGTSWNEPVTIINDKSGNNYSFTPSTGASIRSITNQQNGKNIFRFNGNVDATNVTNIAFSSTARHKWYIVSRVIQFDAQDTLLLAQGNGLQLILFNRTAGAGNFKGEWYVHGGTHLAGTSTNLLNQWVLLSVEWDIPNLQASTWLNGTAYNTNVSNSVLSKITTLQTRLNKYTNVADSDWGELIFTENITQDESDKIEGYLSRKWGLLNDLPSTHPYKIYTP